MAGEVVLVQAMHDQHDGTPELVVEPAVEGVVVPFVRRLALGLRQGFLGLQRIVDDDQVGTPPGQHTADRGGDARALGGRLEFGHGLMARCEAHREEALVPVAGEDAAAIAREFVGEVLGIADAEDLRTRLVSEAPGRKRDRGQVRLQMARQQADEQPAEMGRAHQSYGQIPLTNGTSASSIRRCRPGPQSFCTGWSRHCARRPISSS